MVRHRRPPPNIATDSGYGIVLGSTRPVSGRRERVPSSAARAASWLPCCRCWPRPGCPNRNEPDQRGRTCAATPPAQHLCYMPTLCKRRMPLHGSAATLSPQNCGEGACWSPRPGGHARPDRRCGGRGAPKTGTRSRPGPAVRAVNAPPLLLLCSYCYRHGPPKPPRAAAPAGPLPAFTSSPASCPGRRPGPAAWSQTGRRACGAEEEQAEAGRGRPSGTQAGLLIPARLVR
jgi:hypothetical protein